MKIGTGWLSWRAIACTGMIAFTSLSARAQNLFVGSGGSSLVIEFTPGGAGSVFAALTPNTYGVAFSSEGHLFVTDDS
jgi:hypothetical protein